MSQPSRMQMDKDMEDLFNTFKKEDRREALHQPFLFTMRDTKQKVIQLQGTDLVAKETSSNTDPEKISVVPNLFTQDKQYPIIMGVQGGDRCLSCGMSAPPKLQLEDKKIMDLFNDKEQSTYFTFNSIVEGSTRRFESAAYPGWFLCTSQNDGELVRITDSPGTTNITEFFFQRIH